MFRIALGLICILGAAARQGQDQFAIQRPFRRCFANEEWSECASTCEPTCRNPNPIACTLQCVAGCQCKQGFFRNDNGTCVANCTEDFSKPVCAANEEFLECGTACEPSCRDPTPKVCTLQCVVGCQCKSGFFRNDRNECVAECNNGTSNVCPENEEFKQCGTACEPSCKNPRPLVCTSQCVVNVCQCKHGFFRDSQNKCVAQCGSNDTCGVNEERKRCGTACEPTCTNPLPRCTKNCVTNVCQCREGYIRDSSNKCIPKEQCPLLDDICGVNEERKRCGTACEPTCANPIPRCTKNCVTNVCQCREGYIRDSSNKCILKEHCPSSNNTCGVNEERKRCGTACEPTCANPLPRCTKQCVLNVCQCREGYIRDSSNKCIPKQQCPPSASTTKAPTTVTGAVPQMCGPFENWVDCSRCEPTCTNMNPACGFKCGRPRCECNEGFFRSKLGPCVTMEECRSNDIHR